MTINKNILLLGTLALLLLFGCVKTEAKSNPVANLGDSDITPQAPPSEPLLANDDVVVNDYRSRFVSENDTTVVQTNDLVLANEDVIIDPQ
ncbi:hypothetical protein HY990_06085 [Candidatus Micrarchaeota archaeon]|nr:hypothetical protein [Candidatus Micrarchaeota archaeon]